MKVGDKVILKYDIGEFETEITATAFDECGVKIYNVKGSSKDYYEHELALLIDVEVQRMTEEKLEYYRKHIEECDITILRYLYAELEKERDDIYADYQDLGKQADEIIEELINMFQMEGYFNGMSVEEVCDYVIKVIEFNKKSEIKWQKILEKNTKEE